MLTFALIAGLALAGSGCSASPPPSASPGQTSDPIGTPIAQWRQDAIGVDLSDALTEAAEADYPQLLRTREEWDAWLASLPAPLLDAGLDAEPDFSTEVAAVGMYADCETTAMFTDAGGGVLEFTVSSDDQVACYWSPRVMLVVAIDVAETSAGSTAELTLAS